MMRLVVQWPRFGPYHLARLRAVHALCERRGARLVALETAGADTTYAWREETGAEPFARVQALPGAVYETVAPASIAAAIMAALDRINPTAIAINSYSTPDALAALRWCRRRRRVAVVMMESKADDAVRSPLREVAKRAIVSAYDAALAGGTPQRAYLHALGFPTAAIFEPYDVVDNAAFAAGADAARHAHHAWTALRGVSGGPFFLASSRFVPRKNLTVLLRAYASYRANAPEPWRLVVLGDGPERSALEALVAAESIGGVTFAGFQQIELLPVYYGLAGAFVHVPLVEQWGLVVNEAMAAGLPVVVSRQTGCSQDLVRDNGLTVDATSIQAITAALTHISAPETDRVAMSRRSSEIVAAWSPEAFAEGLFAAVVAGRQRSDRPMPWGARLALGALDVASRSATDFHAIRES